MGWNFRDSDGVSWYAVDLSVERVVLGPFGSPGYARTCADRMDWPRELTVASRQRY